MFAWCRVGAGLNNVLDHNGIGFLHFLLFLRRVPQFLGSHIVGVCSTVVVLVEAFGKVNRFAAFVLAIGGGSGRTFIPTGNGHGGGSGIIFMGEHRGASTLGDQLENGLGGGKDGHG